MPAPLPRTRTLLTTRRHWRKRLSVRRRASGRAHYNYFRDYDPAVGRYVESDPVSQLFYFNFSISPLGRAVLPARIGAGFWNNLFAYGAADPVSNSDSTGQDPIWDYLGKTIGKQAASKIQGMGISGVLAAGCIADNCKRKVTNRDWFGAYADCLAVLSKLQKAAGATQIVGDTNGYISSCADACVSAMPSLKTCPECQRNPEQK